MSCSAAVSPSRMWSDDVDARIEATAGLQMSQPVPVPCLAIRPEKVRMPVACDDLEQLGAGLAEVFAQGLGHLDALRLEQPLEHRNATAAGGSGRGGALDRRHVGGALGNSAADRALGHRVARADLRVVGQRAQAHLGAGRCDQRRRVGRQRPADQRAQGAVRAGVADEDAAQQRRRVVGDDEFGVRALCRVVEHHFQRTVGRARARRRSWRRRRRAA